MPYANPAQKKAADASRPPRNRTAYNAAYYAANAESIRSRASAWAAANSERASHTDAEWRRANPGKVRSYVIARRAAKDCRTPAWDAELTELVTQEAADLARLRALHTGIEWHVDHVIPLRGRRVSGLHTWNNLAVIPGAENVKKSNKFTV